MITKIDINDPKISGHLGNQLFQYAAMIGYAKKNYGDKWNNEICMHRWDVEKYLKNPIGYPFRDYVQQFYTFDGPQYEKTYTEPHFHYAPIPFCEKGLNISGYFQSWRYFEGAEKEVREALEFVPSLKTEVLSRTISSLNCSYNDLLQYNRVTGIHIRLGDYSKLPNHYVQLLQTDYYIRAIQELDDKTDFFLVFSNDIPQCKKYFSTVEEKIRSKVLFVESPQEKSEGNSSAISDLYLMSCCSNFIIANSSMSWWGAWLIRNRDKIVIAPKQWFGPALSMNDTKDLIPPEWIKL